MVEAVGSLAKLLGRTVQPAARVAAPAAVTRPAPGADQAQVAATALARDLATRPPVDAARVAQIKQAIAQGNYPIAPETIADRLLALRLAWHPNDQ